MQLKAKQAFLQHPESLECNMSISELICWKNVAFSFSVTMVKFAIHRTIRHVITQLQLVNKDPSILSKYY